MIFLGVLLGLLFFRDAPAKFPGKPARSLRRLRGAWFYSLLASCLGRFGCFLSFLFWRGMFVLAGGLSVCSCFERRVCFLVLVAFWGVKRVSLWGHLLSPVCKLSVYDRI